MSKRYQFDQYGQCWVTCDILAELLYENPQLDINTFLIKDILGTTKYNLAVDQLYAGFDKITTATVPTVSVEEFDDANQKNWHMPQEYKDLDIAKWVLDQCSTPAELQRVGEELLLFQERDLFDLLKYLKFLVDTMRKNNIVWGVGRGSSVASYVLYLIGIHKINSMYYQLDIQEFLK